MLPEEAKVLLEGVRNGEISVKEALEALRHLPIDDLGFAQLDMHRELRQGMPEAIYAVGKTPEQAARAKHCSGHRNQGSSAYRCAATG
jgi:pyridinium-3,5-biscarboxylic acid mononucleotide synthase